MEVRFRSLTGQSGVLSADPSRPLSELRPALCALFLISEPNLVLILHGQILHSSLPLSSVDITEHETITVFDLTTDPATIPLPASPSPDFAVLPPHAVEELMALDLDLSPSDAFSLLRQCRGDLDHAIEIVLSGRRARHSRRGRRRRGANDPFAVQELIQACPDLTEEDAEEILAMFDGHLRHAMRFALSHDPPMRLHRFGRTGAREPREEDVEAPPEVILNGDIEANFRMRDELNRFRERLTETGVGEYTRQEIRDAFRLVQEFEIEEAAVVHVFEAADRNIDQAREMLMSLRATDLT
jgi:hypothetical protein